MNPVTWPKRAAAVAIRWLWRGTALVIILLLAAAVVALLTLGDDLRVAERLVLPRDVELKNVAFDPIATTGDVTIRGRITNRSSYPLVRATLSVRLFDCEIGFECERESPTECWERYCDVIGDEEYQVLRLGRDIPSKQARDFEAIVSFGKEVHIAGEMKMIATIKNVIARKNPQL
jgi:hypothetical protein